MTSETAALVVDNGLLRYMLCRWELHAGQQEHHRAVLARSKVGCCSLLRGQQCDRSRK